MKLIAEGKAPKTVQPEEGATYDPMIKKDKVQVKVVSRVCDYPVCIRQKWSH